MTVSIKWFSSVVLLSGLLGATAASAATRQAASCSANDVMTAISAASPGDTVTVPAGTCSWSGSNISISGISLMGGGKSTSGTVITAGTVTMTKYASQVTRLSGFRFTGSDSHVSVAGSPSARAFIIDNNYFAMISDVPDPIVIGVNGGLLHHNDFEIPNGGGNADVFGIRTNENWSSPVTFGTADTQGPQGGERNIYFEDNTFTNIWETAPDGDVGARIAIRHNTYLDSSIVFHASAPADSGALTDGGTRQFEIYNNTFSRVSNQSAINKWIWVRGSSGVIANNAMDRASSPDNSTYPNKTDISLTLVCDQTGYTTYPVPHQIGQSIAQTNPVAENPPLSHPLLIFGNTAGPHTDATADSYFIKTAGSGTAGGTCANPDNYIQPGRDYMLSNTWGWVPFKYPHPLSGSSSGGTGTGPSSPTALQAVVK